MKTPRLSPTQKPRTPLVTLRAKTVPSKKRVVSKRACRGQIDLQ